MNAHILLRPPHAIVYDAACVEGPTPRLFEPDYWASAGLLRSTAPGRGSACFVDAPFGPAVLRRYLRGGWPARISRDRYLYTGIERSRPFREFHLLHALRARGLPVPEPLAALCTRDGLAYRGALLTRALAHRGTLADALETGLSEGQWRAVGSAIARLHRAGVRHADLNARNVLLGGPDGEVCFVDFDRAVYRPGRAWDGRGNLSRLRRSLEKLCPPGGRSAVEAGWAALLGAYHA